MNRIAIAEGAADVALVLGALEAHGFSPIATDRHSGLTLSNWLQALGGVKIFVPAVEADEATTLLAGLGMPRWRAPSLWVIFAFAFAWLMASVPPPGLGNYLIRRPGMDVSALDGP
ncbi:hypothetical protein [Paracoccus saliphilus]|uniref:DUF2007 domain-containing protein n=1 Tax=Paracoccus saliphilus TaxID=405559 RepID=A0AA45W465_9RHOB|nr:hypothetical protein [Paracoccus saliphilus]WCR04168.1 hypothetical protein JHX88_05340 [Paracoccus saliphilus]SIS81574.1 hypothetical protein SAMN05421772_105222 [Paracoccus saliphilus]